MKITVYTIPDCQFSKEEKDYLTANKLTYEEKNLEANREFLTEMMTLSNNFAGTPVTKIDKDGQVTVLKGFTKEEFDQALGIAQPIPAKPELSEMNAQVAAPTPAPVPVPPQPPQPPQPIPPTPEPAPQPPPVQPTEPAKTNDQLKSVLADLQQKSTEPAAPQTPPATPPANLPNIPDFK